MLNIELKDSIEVHKKVKAMLTKIEYEVEMNPNSVLDNINTVAIENGKQTQKGKIIEMGLFYGISKVWYKLPLIQRELYGNSLHNWCNYIRMESGQTEQSEKTINNKINLYRTFYSDEHKTYTPQLTVKKDDTSVTYTVEEDLKKVSPTKLLVATGFVNKEGRIPNDVLEVILNEKTSKIDVQNAIRDYKLEGYIQPKQNKKQETEQQKEARLFTKDDGIYWNEGGTVVKLYDTIIDTLPTQHHSNGSKALLGPHGIFHHYNGCVYPENDTPKDNVYTNTDGHVCLTDGLVEFRFTKEQAKALAKMLVEESDK